MAEMTTAEVIDWIINDFETKKYELLESYGLIEMRSAIQDFKFIGLKEGVLTSEREKSLTKCRKYLEEQLARGVYREIYKGESDDFINSFNNLTPTMFLLEEIEKLRDYLKR